MGSQDVILGVRVAHVRELKTALAAANAENARLRAENEALCAHFDLALLAAADLRSLPEGCNLVVVDGWNQILCAGHVSPDRQSLEARWREHLAGRPGDFVWIIYDGSDATTRVEGRLRVSYTGGEGQQRADRMICDFVRMAHWLGLSEKIRVITADKGLSKAVSKITGR